jgi:tetratricopeptide (TPR) repeat protein
LKKALHIFLFLVIIFPAKIYAQVVIDPNNATPTTDEQLAVQYYQAGEYDKAIVYYQKLYEKNPIAIYYNYYLNCLIYTKDFKRAEKTVKKQAGRNPGDLRWHVDMGRVYDAEGDADKKKKEFLAGIDAINNGTATNSVIDLANAFLGINEIDYAIQTLQKGRKELKGTYSFNAELADVYSLKKDYVSMVNEYLDMLEENAAYKQQVKNLLQSKMDADGEDKISGILKTELIKRSQKSPDNVIWPDMLEWLYMQQKNFPAALIQAKAVDKRKHLDGDDIMDLAETAKANGDYETASDAYDYVIALGDGYEHMNFRRAKMGKINSKYESITIGGVYTQEELLALEKEMNATLDELGRDGGTVDLMRSLAHLEAFYLFNTKAAIAILEKSIALPGISPSDQALCKLELGDVLLLDGQVWEASLRYSQVEKAFKYETIGQEAKFRNAKIAFYIGDFKWSQVQLDVLKGSTAKLISNDAMYLSILITENMALDSNTAPLEKFAHADLMVFQNRFDSAIVDLDSIDKEYPNHSLEDDVLFMRYKIAFKQQKWTEAGNYLQKIIDNYPTDILGDDATFLMAELYDYKIADKEKAKQYYQDVYTKYPSSTFATDARKRYRVLRGDKISE